MKSLFNYHFKRRTLDSIKWHDFFLSWIESSEIIEIKCQLKKIYPSEHEFSKREFSAWQIMLRSTGYTNITPWSYDESNIISFILYDQI